MKALGRLMLTYFTGTPISRWISLTGSFLIAAGSACLLYLPPLQAGIGQSSFLSLGQETLLLLLPIVGILLFFFGTALMPVIVAHLASSHIIRVLPHGRLKILASAFTTLAVVTVISGLATVVHFMNFPVSPRLIFIRATSVMFFTYTVLYIIVYWIGKSRKTIGVLGGAMLAIATLSLPVQFIAAPATPLRWPLLGSLLIWGTVIAGFAFTSHFKAACAALGRRAGVGNWRTQTIKTYKPGREVDSLIGVDRPWVLALGQIAPIVIATFFISRSSLWLFYFALFSAISGAITSFAAARSRPLWLRTDGSRSDLFTQVEAAFWRNNCYAMGVLLLLFVAIGISSQFETSPLALGLPLLALGTGASTYLGLMMTRGVGALEAFLGITTMALLMGTAAYAAEKTADIAVVIALESTLAVLAVGFRYVAKRRWSSIDWTMCRPE